MRVGITPRTAEGYEGFVRVLRRFRVVGFYTYTREGSGNRGGNIAAKRRIRVGGGDVFVVGSGGGGKVSKRKCWWRVVFIRFLEREWEDFDGNALGRRIVVVFVGFGCRKIESVERGYKSCMVESEELEMERWLVNNHIQALRK